MRITFVRAAFGVVPSVLALLVPLHLAAQEPAEDQPAPPQLLLIHQEVVDPPMLAQYEDTTKRFFALVAANREAMPTFHADAFQTDEMVFVYVLPLADFAQMDALMGEFMAMEQAGGDAWTALMKEGGATTRQYDEWVVLHRPDLSYTPAEPRLQPAEEKAFRWDYYYLRGDQVQEAEALAKDVAALYRSAGVTDGFQLYQAVLGSDLPLFVVVSAGRDEADVAARSAAIEASLGDAWAPFVPRIRAVSRAVETKRAWARPDLSLAPPPTQE
jgi:hypothetical protein